MNKISFLSFIFLFISIGLIPDLKAQQIIRYVKPVSSGTGDGSSWSNASDNLLSIIEQSADNDEIWVATGTYEISSSLVIVNSIKLYGGFSGIESTLSERNPEINETILSGDIGIKDVIFDNQGVIAWILDEKKDVLIDGFTFRDVYNLNCLWVSEPAEIVNTYLYSSAIFGNLNYNLTAEVASADPIDACNTIVNDLSGKIALIQRGTCTFESKALAAQNAGAVAVIIYNNVSGAMPGMSGTDESIIIPIVGISMEDGQLFLDEINSGKVVKATLRSTSPGASILVFKSKATISQCDFYGNFGYNGSAVFSDSSDISIENSRFFNNQSTLGTINSRGLNTTIENCEFFDNTGGNSAGIYINNNGVLFIDSCSFTANLSSFGAALSFYGDSAVLNHCYFGNNRVFGGGGGIHTKARKLIVENSFFYQNHAVSEDFSYGTGGAIQVESPDANLEIVNSVFAENNAGGKIDDGGGAIMIYSGKVNAANVTIVNNSSASIGGGISIFDNTGSATLINTILWENKALIDSTAEISNVKGSVQINYSDIRGEDPVTGTGNMNVDPVFVNRSLPLGEDNIAMTRDDGLELHESSPLIDKGDQSYISISLEVPETDIIGNLRSDTFDIGAYEFVPISIDGIIIHGKEVLIYPNPAKTSIDIRTDGFVGNITATDLTGTIIWKGDRQDFPLNISNWSPGLYILRFAVNDEVITNKLIKN